MNKFFSGVLLIFFCSFAWQLGHQKNERIKRGPMENDLPCHTKEELSVEGNRKLELGRLNSNNSPNP